MKNILENRDYCYYIAAIRSDGQASLSNKACVFTRTPPTPTYILGNYSQTSGNQVNLHFVTDPAIIQDSYRLYRAPHNSNNWEVLTELNKDSNGELHYADNLPDKRVYDYKIVYLNRCKQEGIQSVPINNIVLTAKNELLNNYLTWNSFETWENGISYIEVYRNTDQVNSLLLATFAPGETNYTDIIPVNEKLSDELCYQIKAVSNPDRFGEVNISESNVICVSMLGLIFVPNAFTPESNDMNNEFKPDFGGIIPSKYSLMIYDRYGFKIFETNKISEGWNGRLPDGKKAIEGAYIYYIRVENSSGKTLEKRGNFTVIYP
ncbi:MAG: T9SS type B sorting domain-containing protein [Bacteroidetes bacterium]|nr:T9SS type B sorting domain-containing protein [Bacteroidota bacterium]